MRGNKMYSLSVIAIAYLLALALAQPVAAQGRSGKCGVSATVTFREEAGDAVRGYVTGATYPTSFACQGGYSFGLSSEQGFVFYLNEANRITGAPLTPPLDTVSGVAANVGVEIAVVDGFLSMRVNDTAEVTKIQFNFIIGDERFFLRWGSNYTNVGASSPRVTRTAEDTWVIETLPAPFDVGSLRQCPARGACKAPFNDRTYHAPLQMTLVAQLP